MPTDFSLFPRLAAKQVRSDSLRGLFDQLAARAQSLVELHDQLQSSIRTNRETRTGKPFRFTGNQKRILAEFEKDAEDAAEGLAAQVARLSDAALLNVALRDERQQLESEERVYAVFREENRLVADKVLAFRRETIRLIEHFIENSEFRDRVSPDPRMARRLSGKRDLG